MANHTTVEPKMLVEQELNIYHTSDKWVSYWPWH